jgi:transposase/cell division protein FtsB
MTINCDSIRKKCASNPDAIVVLIEEYEETVADEKAKNTILEEQIRELKEQNKVLEEKNRELEAQCKQTSRNSSKPPSTDVFIKPKSQRKKGERPVGGQIGHPGHTLEPVKNPDKQVPHKVKICEECGASLEDVPIIDLERRQVFDIPPQKIVVTEHQAEHKQCPQCGCHNRGKFPSGVEYPVQYGQEIKVLMVYLSVFQLIPYERICEFFTDLFGFSFSKATLAKAIKNCNDNLAGYEEIVKQALSRAPVLHVDETGFRVTGKRRWLHVASTALLTWYGHHKIRGKSGTDALQILPNFKGTMVHDFWKAYFQYDCLHAICNAHLIRELTGITENFGQLWSEQMKELTLEIKKEVDSAKLRLCLLSLQQIADFEARYARIIELGKQENPVTEYVRPVGKRGRKKHSKAKNLLNRFESYHTEILAFMYDFSIPFDNNLVERDIRMTKVQQKISGTFRSEEGADWFCRIRGYISTVRKNDRPVLASIKNAFEGKPFIPEVAL